MKSKVGTSQDEDPLEGSPALPPLPAAKAPAAPAIPSASSSGDGGTRALAMMGAKPSVILLNGMATIEQQVQAMSQHLPGFIDIAQAFIDQMKVLGMARIAEMANGGTGGLPGMAGAPPPLPGGGGMAPGMGMGAGMPMMPPPPV